MILANLTIKPISFVSSNLTTNQYKNLSLGLMIESEHIDEKIEDILYQFRYTFYIYFLTPILCMTVFVFILEFA
jgi:hypothetical protein